MKTGRKLALIAVAAALVLLVGVGISYAWFSQHAALSTLMKILPPDFIDILPVKADGGELEMLDLDFKEGVDDKYTVGNDTTITIRRPVKIYSTSPVHQLEVVHTTNLNNLEFKIYPTTLDQEGNFVVPDFENAKPTPIAGEYKNEKNDNPKLAKEEILKNYQSTDDVADTHAYPLYWLARNCGDKDYVASGWVDDSDEQPGWTDVESSRKWKYDSAKQDYKFYYSTYYYLEISWQENSKETDLFYIMAKNVAVTEKKEGSVSP